MIRKFEDVTVIDNRELYDKVSAYGDDMINAVIDNKFFINPFSRQVLVSV